MIRAAIRGVVLVWASLALSCGGGNDSPSGPSAGPTPAPTPTPVPPLSVIDGVTGAPVGVAGAPTSVAVGSRLTLEAPGYLLRDQKYEGKPVALWPGDQDYVNALVYDSEFTDGSFRLTRWPSAFTVTLDSPIASEPGVIQAADEAVAEIRRTTGLNVTLGPGGATVIRVDSRDPVFQGTNYIAYARNRYQGANIVGAQVVFSELREIVGRPGTNYRNTLLHEVGHVLGLGHSLSGNDVMDPGGRAHPGGKRATFSDGETGLLRMMYIHRKAGNRPPDADPGIFMSSLQSDERIIID